MESRFVRPETVRLDITGGDWLLVKKRLTAGEQRRVFDRMVKTMNVNEKIAIDPLQAGLSTVLAYLIDWSLVDDQGAPVVIRDQSIDTVTAILDALGLDSFTEIMDAIQIHDAAMTAEREQEKKRRGAVNRSSLILLSPAAAAGGTNGS